MTRVALDSNILIYAELEPDSEKGKRAADVILVPRVTALYRRKCSGNFFGSFNAAYLRRSRTLFGKHCSTKQCS